MMKKCRICGDDFQEWMTLNGYCPSKCKLCWNTPEVQKIARKKRHFGGKL